jgi:hypothetical protein
MDSKQAQEVSERDQLWASLRALRPEIDQLATGNLDGSERQTQIIQILGRIVCAEMDFRVNETNLDYIPPAQD